MGDHAFADYQETADNLAQILAGPHVYVFRAEYFTRAHSVPLHVVTPCELKK
jgi:hypothetical protein